MYMYLYVYNSPSLVTAFFFGFFFSPEQRSQRRSGIKQHKQRRSGINQRRRLSEPSEPLEPEPKLSEDELKEPAELPEDSSKEPAEEAEEPAFLAFA